MVPLDADILEQGQVGLIEPRTPYGVAASVPDLAGILRQGQPLEALGVEPLVDAVRGARVGIAGLVGGVGREAEGHVHRLDHPERRAGLCLHDAVDLPTAQELLHDGALPLEARQLDPEAQH